MAGLIAAIAAIITGAAVWTLKPIAPSGGAIVARMTVSLPSGVRLADLQYPAVAVSPDARSSRTQPLKGALDSYSFAP
jgi:hypothetical protein